MGDPSDLADLFGGPLRADPAVALDSKRLRLPARTRGPIHGVQFVVELAGPRSVLAQPAHALLGPEWQAALGEPEVYAMAPADQEWRPMATSDSGSYDSLALAWDVLNPKGALSSSAARHLAGQAERFANSFGRRAFPFPAPEEVDRLAAGLQQVRDALDIGIELIVQGDHSFAERDIWQACAAVGLDLSGQGFFVWRIPGWDEPVLTVAPLEEGATYSLRGIRAGATFEAMGVGFRIPLSPDPERVWQEAVRVAHVLAERLGGSVYDDEGLALSPAREAMLRSSLEAAARSMAEAGLPPGSASALRLFR
jgi:hypothetical protein